MLVRRARGTENVADGGTKPLKTRSHRETWTCVTSFRNGVWSVIVAVVWRARADVVPDLVDEPGTTRRFGESPAQMDAPSGYTRNVGSGWTNLMLWMSGLIESSRHRGSERVRVSR